MMRQPPHLLVALITAFKEDGDLALDDHAHNVAHLMERGVEGFLIGGSTGEGPYLEEGERQQLVATAREVAGEDAFLMGATAAQSTRAASLQIDEIAAGGADAALVLTPTSLVRGNHVAVRRFYAEVADASPIPVLLYSVPRVTGYELPVDVIASLASHPTIIGLKDSGGRPYRMQEVANSVAADFIQFAGASAAIAPSIAAGAYGAITASTNYIPVRIDYLVESARHAEGDVEGQQAAIAAVTKVVELHGVVGTKAAAVLSGMRSASVRRPLVALDSSAVAEIRNVIPAGV
jgi:dihydrodipicolinate synthase/N-acetylneuraminate lyase